MAIARIKRIFLIRHAESEGNVDQTIHTTMPDHAIPLSSAGLEQADMAGEFLVKWLEENVRGRTSPYVPNPMSYMDPRDRIRLWNSPYKRTRQTSEAIAKRLSGDGTRDNDWLLDRAENILLCEQQFGLFDGIPDEELPVRFPQEHAHYKKCEDFEGRYWSRMPLGESRFDVCQRVHQAFGTFLRDAERHEVENIGIVGHGVTNRAFRMMWMHRPWEWFEAEKNPGNCSISLIEFAHDKTEGWCYVDRGYIFYGFHGAKP